MEVLFQGVVKQLQNQPLAAGNQVLLVDHLHAVVTIAAAEKKAAVTAREKTKKIVRLKKEIHQDLRKKINLGKEDLGLYGIVQ